MAALEAVRVDHRAVLAAVNARGENQRDLSGRVGAVDTAPGGVGTRLDVLETELDDTGITVRSIEAGMAEVEDLLVRALDR